MHGEALVYGLNTGLGHMRNERVPIEMLRAYQYAVVVGHAGAIGDPLPTEVVRATMAARLAGFAIGGSGVSPAVADALAALLNARVHPIVPEAGSVGASDLMHLAAVAEVLLGMGWAELDGERIAGAEALRRAGLAPVALEPKDALAIISANAVSVGHGGARHAPAPSAPRPPRTSSSRSRSRPIAAQPLDRRSRRPRRQARPRPDRRGPPHRRAARGLHACRRRRRPRRSRTRSRSGSARRSTAASARSTAVLAPARRDSSSAPATTTRSSPIDEGRTISNGNFHPFAMALAVDALRPAIAHVGQLSDRRMNHLFGALTADPALFTDPSVAGGQPRSSDC